jgi:hypothetical protein
VRELQQNARTLQRQVMDGLVRCAVLDVGLEAQEQERAGEA